MRQSAGMAGGGLIERRDESERLQKALEVARGGRGTLASITGRPGTGKSSLLQETALQAVSEGFRVLRLRCERSNRTRPFALLSELAREELPEGRARLLAPLRDGRPISDDQAKEGLYWTLSGLGETQPLLCAVDDIHWIDPPSLNALADLIVRMEDLHLLVLVSARPLEPDSEPAYKSIVAAADPKLVTRELSREGSAALVHRRFATAPGDFTAECHRVTAGNPFLLTSLLDAIADDRLPLTKETVTAAVPGDVDRLAAERLRSLSPAAQALARAIALLGNGTDLALVADAAGIELQDAVQAGGELIARGLLSPTEDTTFTHDLIRLAIVRSLGAEERDATIDRALERAPSHGWDELARAGLLLQVGAQISSTSRALLLRAAEAALDAASPSTALQFVQRAVRDEDSPSVAELILLGRASAAIDMQAAELYMKQALERDPVAQERETILELLGDLYTATGRYLEARPVFEEAAGISSDARSARHFKARALSSGWMAGEVTEEGRAEIVSLLREERIPLTPGDRTFLVVAAAASSFFGGIQRRESVQLALRAWEGGRLLEDDLLPGSEAPYLVTGILNIAAEHHKNLEVNDALLAKARDEGSLTHFASASYVRACPLFDLARIEEAEAHARSAVDAQRRGWGQYLYAAKGYLAFACLELDDFEAAARAAAYEPADAEGRMDLVVVLTAEGRLLLEQGRFSEAARVLDRAQEAFLAVGYRCPDLIPLPPVHFEAVWRAGRLEDARALYEEFRMRAEAWGSPRARARALRMRSFLEEEDRIELLEHAVRVGREGEAELDNLWLEKELGEAYASAGRMGEARELLYEVAGTAQTKGCRLLARKTLASLAAAGGRARRISSTGWRSLTPAEKRIARLVAEGRSNTEVAEALFVSVKTVKSHLTSIFRKLEVANRMALIRVVEAVDSELE